MVIKASGRIEEEKEEEEEKEVDFRYHPGHFLLKHKSGKSFNLELGMDPGK
jgi:hypothetical protein